MGLLSSIKSKFKGDTKINVIIHPEVLNELKKKMDYLNKDVVRFKVAGFG